MTFSSGGYYSGGYILSDTYALGRSEQQANTYTRQAGTNFVVSATDALGRLTNYTYDACGNRTSVARSGVTTSFTYQTGNPCVSTFNRLTSVTDALGHTTSCVYDGKGNLIAATDPLGTQVTIAYNNAGQPVSVSGPPGTQQYSYTAGILAGVTTTAGAATQRLVDSAGRPIALTDPRGYVTRYAYDGLSRVTQMTNALSGISALTYDPNGNILSLSDARGDSAKTNYTYDSRNRWTGRTDPLQHSDSYEYDASGNLTRFKDRQGHLMNYVYDGLNRLTQATYPDNSTIQYTYDAGNRLVQVIDSTAGTITRTYDGLDRLAAETTPQGTVTYTYDADGRRTSMTVSGQGVINYSYDDGDRLTQISQGTSTVMMAYDAGGRILSLAMPNGVVESYSYDAASRLAEISYTKDGATLGNLTYQYDAAGNRTQTGGSFSRVALPPAVSAASYNSGNQLTQWGTSSLSYDLNGNLTNDGAITYNWNVRNQLLSMTGAGLSASFQYDAFGRRTRKTVGGTVTEYLYDGKNVVQELSGGAPVADLLTGLAVDAVFTRTDSAGTRVLISDGLNLALALVDANGIVQEYTYEPYGKTTATGLSSGNSVQYTGRENDGTGLYFNRARYYSPSLGRFLSEDPVGFRGGVNVYAYALNSPVVFTDPLGLRPQGCDGECGQPPPRMSVADALKCCSNEEQVPPGGPSPYRPEEQFAGIYRGCIYQTGGNNTWANYVRGCLKCVRERGPDNQSEDPDVLTPIYNFCWRYGFGKAGKVAGLFWAFMTMMGNPACAVDPYTGPLVFPPRGGKAIWW